MAFFLFEIASEMQGANFGTCECTLAHTDDSSHTHTFAIPILRRNEKCVPTSLVVTLHLRACDACVLHSLYEVGKEPTLHVLHCGSAVCRPFICHSYPTNFA